MAEIYQPLQLCNPETKEPLDRWRMVVTSDEDSRVFCELCDCENGHETPEAARECGQASDALEKAGLR